MSTDLAEENRNVLTSTPAGWGFCVVLGDTGLGKGQGEIVTERSGHCNHQKTSSEYIGSEVGSNNTFETLCSCTCIKMAINGRRRHRHLH